MFGLSKKTQESPKPDEVGIFICRLERIISQTADRTDWEDMSIQFDDKRAEALRQLFHQVSDAFHGTGMISYSPEGMNVLKAILTALKKERDEKPVT
jgi:hypothetical protein